MADHVRPRTRDHFAPFLCPLFLLLLALFHEGAASHLGPPLHLHPGSLDNSVLGDPLVECGPDSILVAFKTAQPFDGRLYVEGESERPGCSRLAKENGPIGTSADFRIRFGDCNMRRQRTLNPRGVAFSVTVVASFHPLFVTGHDRAFHVRCFFVEAVKALESALDVAKLTTQIVEREFALPQCHYQLRQGADGPPLKYAAVGDPVTHVWQCDPLAGLVYGVLIHSCFVDDGHGNKFPLIDDRGCAVDRFLLGDLHYDPHVISASVDSHVFKYADRIQLFFTCTVQLCFKEDGGCQGITPPKCGGGFVPDRLRRPSGPPLPPGLHRRPLPSSAGLRPPGPRSRHLFSNGQEPSSNDVETKFPEEAAGPRSRGTPKNEDFFGPIRSRGHGPLTGQEREKAGENPFGAAGYELSPFGSPFKDSPLANETETKSGQNLQEDAVVEVLNSPNDGVNGTDVDGGGDALVDDVTNLMKHETAEARERSSRAAKQMESDLTVELTVMPIENGLGRGSKVDMSQIEPMHCFTLTRIAVFMFGSLAAIVLTSIVTALFIGKKYWQKTRQFNSI